eukprot:1237242-Prymnesium_polylepis.1
MTLADLDRLQEVIKRCNELKGAFQEKNGWVRVHALVRKISDTYVVTRHSDTCIGRDSNNLCGKCNVPAFTPQGRLLRLPHRRRLE